MQAWEARFRAQLRTDGFTDAAHGLDHLQRVVASAKRLGAAAGAEPAVVVPAAWLHDCVSLEKNDPRRRQASRLAAERARQHLSHLGYPGRWHDAIAHAIEAHSFSAQIPPRTLEAKVVQDADRLDALGAVGLARCFMVGERLGRPLYAPADPFCENRSPDDQTYTLDHLYAKLLRLPATMQTAAGRAEAQRRADFLRAFLDQLASELPGHVQ